MKKFNYVAPILLGASLFVHANEEFLVDGVLVPTAQPNTQSCISYFPVMGLVKETEDLKINSDKFKFTDDKKLILDGSVELDFPEGLLRAQSAELDRENGKIKFSNNGGIFLKDFYFNADGGYLNKDDKSISLSKGIVFSKERSLIFNFLELYGQLDQKIYLKNTSMTSCANPDQGWVLQAKEIILNSGIQLILALLCLHSIGFLFGFLISLGLFRSWSVAKTISIEVGMQNSGLGVVLARENFSNPMVAIPAAISSLIHSLLGSLFVSLFKNKN